jgi:hypothetical protein
MVYATPLVCFVPHLLRGDFSPAESSLASPAERQGLRRRTAFQPPTAARPLSQRLHADIATDANTDADLELLPKIQAAILEENGDGADAAMCAWKDAVDVVASNSGLSEDLAELALAKAYGWRAWVKVTSKFAKKYMKISIPDIATLQAALDWPINGPLEFTKDQLAQAIHLSPEVYLINPASNYEKALSVAPEPYNDVGKFIKLVNEDSIVLTCTTNCVDSGCASNCGNCWVSYNMKSL